VPLREKPTPAAAAAFLITDSNLAPLPLYGDARRIAHLDPDGARAGPVGAFDPLRNDALRPNAASVRKDGWAIYSGVFINQDARFGLAQQARQRGFAVEKRQIAQILAIMLDQVECRRDCGSSHLSATQLLEPSHTVRPEHNRLAVNRELFASISSAAAAMADSRMVQS
jgi:hypothetical protein